MKRRIAIVGGGPAGSSFALHALRCGIAAEDLLIIDKAIFPRPKLCGGALTFRGTGLLEELIGQPLGGATTIGVDIRTPFGSMEAFEPGPQWLYDRALLDELLLRACQREGVEVRENTRIDDIQPAVDGWRVVSGGRAETFEWLIGADGALSTVRRAINLPGGWTGRLLEGIYEPVGHRGDPTHLVFDWSTVSAGIPGYGWIFPYPKPGSERPLYKIGVMDGRGTCGGAELRRWVDTYAETHGYRRVDDKLAGWPEHYWSRRNRAHAPGLILIGEAWGIEPFLGEGIAPALETARYAAHRLKLALDGRRRRIRGFELGFLLTEPGQGMLFCTFLANRIYGQSGEAWVRRLARSHTLSRALRSRNAAYGRNFLGWRGVLGRSLAALLPRALLLEPPPAPPRARLRPPA